MIFYEQIHRIKLFFSRQNILLDIDKKSQISLEILFLRYLQNEFQKKREVSCHLIDLFHKKIPQDFEEFFYGTCL